MGITAGGSRMALSLAGVMSAGESLNEDAI